MAETIADQKFAAFGSGLLDRIYLASGTFGWIDFWKTQKRFNIPASTTLHTEFLVNLTPPAFIADIGCGEGRQTKQLENLGFRTAGIDINLGALIEAKNKGNTLYAVGDGADLPFASETFKCAILMGVLSLTDPLRRIDTLRETARIVGRGGYVYIGEFARVNQETWEEVYQIDQKYTHEDGSVLVVNWEIQKVAFITHHFRKEELTSLLQVSGLEDIQLRDQEIVSVVGGRHYSEICAWGTKV